MPTARSATVLLIACAAACSGGGNSPPVDSIQPDTDGACGQRFLGEFQDWDSTSARFCGIAGAEFSAPGTAVKITTPPNGRVDLCVLDEPVVLVDIKPPTAPSECTDPRGSYMLPAIAVVNRAVIAAGASWSGRAFITGKQTIDSTKAQVFVHIDGTARAVSITAAHGPAQARTNDAWAPGDTGQDIFFPDVELGTGTTTLAADASIGTGSIPLVAGKMTTVTIAGR